MDSFTKLFASITDSTIWQEDNDTRIVWITMMAMADRHGYVGASVPGLADRARVSVAAVEAALAKFLSPDKYSRSPEHEGRRIEVVDRGWRLLNHAKFREAMSKEDRRIKNREYKRRSRERSPSSKPPELSDDGMEFLDTEDEAKERARQREISNFDAVTGKKDF